MLLLISPFQKVLSRIHVTTTTPVLWFSLMLSPSPPAREVKAPLTKRAVSQFGLQPSVPDSKISEASGGSRKYGSIADGMRLRVAMETLLLQNCVKGSETQAFPRNVRIAI